jgi:hypothetical protein
LHGQRRQSDLVAGHAVALDTPERDEALLHAVGVIDVILARRSGCAGHPDRRAVQLIGDAFVWHDGHAGRGI